MSQSSSRALLITAVSFTSARQTLLAARPYRVLVTSTAAIQLKRPASVLSVRNGFHMIGIHAVALAAEVVRLHSQRNRAVRTLISDHMCRADLSRGGVELLSVTTVDLCALPDVTGRAIAPVFSDELNTALSTVVPLDESDRFSPDAASDGIAARSQGGDLSAPTLTRLHAQSIQRSDDER